MLNRLSELDDPTMSSSLVFSEPGHLTTTNVWHFLCNMRVHTVKETV